MTTTALSLTRPTLLDILKATDPSGNMLPVVEALSQQNGLIKDAVWKESNSQFGHLVSTRTGLPSVTARRFNRGSAASKSKRDQFTETLAMLETRAHTDVKLAALNGGAGYRKSEEDGHVQAMNNELERMSWYGATATAPDEFNGLTGRLDLTTGPFGQQIVLCDSDAAGNDQASMWLVCWGDASVYMCYPKGSTTGGLKMTDRGIQGIDDADGNRFEAYESVWNWDAGIVVEDARQLVRVANIDAVKVAAGTSEIINSMITGYHQIFDPNKGRLAWYCNRAMQTYLHIQALNRSTNSTFSVETDLVNGQPVVKFMGIPIRRSDELLSTENLVS